MSKKYVIFSEIESEAPEAAHDAPELQFAIINEAGFIETAMRSRATEFDDPGMAYARAGRFSELADWRVGAR